LKNYHQWHSWAMGEHAMMRTSAEGVKAAIAKLTPEQRNKLLVEAPASEQAGRILTDEQVPEDLIQKAYNAGSDSLSFDDWVSMKLPVLDKSE
jgi:hypothetical protein